MLYPLGALCLGNLYIHLDRLHDDEVEGSPYHAVESSVNIPSESEELMEIGNSTLGSLLRLIVSSSLLVGDKFGTASTSSSGNIFSCTSVCCCTIQQMGEQPPYVGLGPFRSVSLGPAYLHNR